MSTFESGGPYGECNNCGCFLGEHLATALQPKCPAHTTRKEWVEEFWKQIEPSMKGYSSKMQSLLDRLPLSELAEVVEEMRD